MFIKYEDEKKIINLNNYDEIRVEKSIENHIDFFSIIAVKSTTEIHSDSGIMDIWSDGYVKKELLRFSSETEANAMYDEIEKAWMTHQTVFVIPKPTRKCGLGELLFFADKDYRDAVPIRICWIEEKEDGFNEYKGRYMNHLGITKKLYEFTDEDVNVRVFTDQHLATRAVKNFLKEE